MAWLGLSRPASVPFAVSMFTNTKGLCVSLTACMTSKLSNLVEIRGNINLFVCPEKGACIYSGTKKK